MSSPFHTYDSPRSVIESFERELWMTYEHDKQRLERRKVYLSNVRDDLKREEAEIAAKLETNPGRSDELMLETEKRELYRTKTRLEAVEAELEKLLSKIYLKWIHQSRLENDAKLAWRKRKRPGKWVEILRPDKFETWKKQDMRDFLEWHAVVERQMKEKEEQERIADMEKQEQEGRAMIARQEREKEAEIERAKREREAELARQERKRKDQILKEENERLAEMIRQEQEIQAESERQEQKRRAEMEKHRLTELRKSEYQRFARLMETFEQERESDLRRQVELTRRYDYDDLSLSPSRFRLLRLHSARESLFLRKSHGIVPARPKAKGSIRQKYDIRLFDAQEEHRKQQVLFNDSFEGALECSMQTFDLEDPDCPHFEALSYEWKAYSDKGNKRLLFCNESNLLGSMEIGYNLWSFLKHIQQPDDEFWVWADAVCINQTSLQERGHQVKLMGQIYTRASKVLAWTPVENPGPCAAKWRQIIAGQSLDGKQLGAAMDLFHSQYWTRKWIIQEILLARTVVIVLGDYEFPMQDLESKFREQGQKMAIRSSPSSTSAFNSLPFATLAAYRRSRREGKAYPTKLYELLPMYQSNMCSDPFDHVYALYNLIGEHRQHLEVKYGEPPRLWISKVLQFLDRYEQSSRSTMIYLAVTLSRQVGSYDLHSAKLSPQEPPIHFTATAFDQGAVTPREECATSMYLRGQVGSLHPGAKMTFKMVSGCWQIHYRAPSSTITKVSKRVLDYFDIPDQSLCGMATARIEEGDHVLTFVNTNFGFVVRFEKSSTEGAEESLRILGRCYLFEKSSADSTANEGEDWKPMESFGSDNSRSNGKRADPNSNKLHSNGKKLGKKLMSHDLKLGISDLFTLAYAATDIEFPRTSQGADATRTTERRTDVGFQRASQEENATRATEERRNFEEKPRPSKRGGIFGEVSSAWGSV